jgi:hypothetical protein
MTISVAHFITKDMEDDTGISFKEVKAQMKEMYFTRSNIIVCYGTMVYYICESMIYYLALYNAANLPGNKLINTLVFCLAEIVGVVTSQKVSVFLSIRIGTFISYGGIFVCNILIKYAIGDSVTWLYVLLVIQSFLVGQIFNFANLIMNKIVNQKYQMTAFEINYSLSMTFSMITPLIASLSEPAPTIAITAIAVIACAMTFMMDLSGDDKKSGGKGRMSIVKDMQSVVVEGYNEGTNKNSTYEISMDKTESG